jgi:hypothetical protein
MVIANRSSQHRGRVREVFARPLEDGAVVRQYEDFAKFVEGFPACFN